MGITEAAVTEAAVNRISTVEARDDEEILRVYMEYQSLYLTDLHRIFQPLARAYAYLNGSGPVPGRFPSQGRAYETMPGRGYVARYQPLRVETLETGHSLILLCKGAAAVILALADVAKKVFEAAEKYWEMKEAQDTRRSPSKPEQPPVTRHHSGRARLQAEKEVEELANYVEKTTRITEFHLQLDGLTWTHTKSTTSQSKSSQRQ